jgi:16S rRNA processing protein RimM
MSQGYADARLIGIVKKPHGIKGQTIVMLLTDYPDSIFKGQILYFDRKCSRKAVVDSIHLKRIKRKIEAVIKFRGIDSRDDASRISGEELYRLSKDAPSPGYNEFWIDELEECRVILSTGKAVGKVERVDVLPANEVLLVRTEEEDENKEKNNFPKYFYIPFVKDYIEEIDISRRIIIIKKIPEYI